MALGHLSSILAELGWVYPCCLLPASLPWGKHSHSAAQCPSPPLALLPPIAVNKAQKATSASLDSNRVFHPSLAAAVDMETCESESPDSSMGLP